MFDPVHRPWVRVCLVLVAFQVVFAAAMRTAIPMPQEIPNPLLGLSGIVAPMAAVLLGLALVRVRQLAIAGDPRPLRAFRPSHVAAPLILILMVSAHLTAFAAAKPTLGGATRFYAGPHIAAFESALFGTEPWRILAMAFGKGIAVVDVVYFTWFFVLMMTLAFAMIRNDYRAVPAFFLTWSAGMVLQFALPSAGPIFFERNGFGHQFADIPVSPLTGFVSNILWQDYSAQMASATGGISAWPSLHVALAVWVSLFWRHPLAYLWTAMIAVGSVALGWHYVSDTLGGALMAILCWRVCAYSMTSMANHVYPAITLTELSAGMKSSSSK